MVGVRIQKTNNDNLIGLGIDLTYFYNMLAQSVKLLCRRFIFSLYIKNLYSGIQLAYFKLTI